MHKENCLRFSLLGKHREFYVLRNTGKRGESYPVGVTFVVPENVKLLTIIMHLSCLLILSH